MDSDEHVRPHYVKIATRLFALECLMSTMIVIWILVSAVMLGTFVGVLFLIRLTWQVLRMPRIRTGIHHEFMPSSGERLFR